MHIRDQTKFSRLFHSYAFSNKFKSSSVKSESENNDICPMPQYMPRIGIKQIDKIKFWSFLLTIIQQIYSSFFNQINTINS